MLKVECSVILQYVWDWFCALNETRNYSENGAMAISYAEIAAWRDLTGERPSPDDISLIKKIDRISRTKK